MSNSWIYKDILFFIFHLLTGRPVRMMVEESNQPNFLEKKFRQACSWNAFTIDRTMTNWTYNVFICK